MNGYDLPSSLLGLLLLQIAPRITEAFPFACTCFSSCDSQGIFVNCLLKHTFLDKNSLVHYFLLKSKLAHILSNFPSLNLDYFKSMCQ